MDFWHPELEEGERMAITQMFAPIMNKRNQAAMDAAASGGGEEATGGTTGGGR